MSAVMRTSLFVLTTAIVTFLASHAHADPQPFDRRDGSRIGAGVGLFTPTGELGLEYTQALHPNLEVGVGAGVGLVRTGPQLAVMPRLRTRRGAFTLSLGTGLSVGRFNNISPFADEQAPHVLSVFANGEAGLQVTSKRGPFARVYAGAGKIVAHEAVEPEYRDELKDVIPYGGVTVGWVF